LIFQFVPLPPLSFYSYPSESSLRCLFWRFLDFSRFTDFQVPPCCDVTLFLTMLKFFTLLTPPPLVPFGDHFFPCLSPNPNLLLPFGGRPWLRNSPISLTPFFSPGKVEPSRTPARPDIEGVTFPPLVVSPLVAFYPGNLKYLTVGRLFRWGCRLFVPHGFTPF